MPGQTKDTGRFDLPEDYLEWNPTCRHTGPLMELTREFLDREYDQRLCLFYVWGHSYGFEQDQNWEQMEAFAREAGGRDEIWYASNLEIYDYMKAASELRFTADCSRVFNPSALDVWIKADGIVCQIPGEMTELRRRTESIIIWIRRSGSAITRPRQARGRWIRFWCITGKGVRRKLPGTHIIIWENP